MHKAIEINELSFSYGEEQLLRRVELEIEIGEYAVLLGENGTGKSTLLKILTGELKEEYGKVRLFGEEVGVACRSGAVGYVPQNVISRNSFFPAVVEEIVLTGLYHKIGRFRFPDRQHRRLALEALKQVRMEDYAKAGIGELSGGQQQRVMLARALAADPRLLILDEPATGVDMASVTELYQTLEQLNRERGLTILMVTHGSPEACPGISRIYYMKEGSVQPA